MEPHTNTINCIPCVKDLVLLIDENVAASLIEGYAVRTPSKRQMLRHQCHVEVKLFKSIGEIGLLAGRYAASHNNPSWLPSIESKAN